MWKADVRQNWTRVKLEDFCTHTGVPFSTVFEGALEFSSAPVDPYPQYRWAITENSRIPFGVLHLVPPHVGVHSALWEEWFVDAGQFHHHVLRNHPHGLATDIWQGDLADKEHPQEVLGFQWHHFNDVDLRPVRYR